MKKRQQAQLCSAQFHLVNKSCRRGGQRFSDRHRRKAEQSTLDPHTPVFLYHTHKLHEWITDYSLRFADHASSQANLDETEINNSVLLHAARLKCPCNPLWVRYQLTLLDSEHHFTDTLKSITDMICQCKNRKVLVFSRQLWNSAHWDFLCKSLTSTISFSRPLKGLFPTVIHWKIRLIYV